MYNNQDSLGFVETCGLTAAIEVADAMAKTADVTIEAAHKVDAGLICVICSGDIASCKAAVDAGVAVAVRMGSLAGANVIARPADEEAGVGLLTPLATINARKAAKKAAKHAKSVQNTVQNTDSATTAPVAAKQTLRPAEASVKAESVATPASPAPQAAPVPVQTLQSAPKIQPEPKPKPATPAGSEKPKKSKKK